MQVMQEGQVLTLLEDAADWPYKLYRMEWKGNE